ncbi:MAG TPA: hypothetical protein VNF73_05385 [Candidatus Saccharimonadales bacterium]|nr:hypothetical protein [Candidatus Saccharimonadales bacterium]
MTDGTDGGAAAATSSDARARAMTPAVGGERLVPVPDDVAREYLLLALRLEQRVPGLVDGYFGPANLKAQVDMESLAAPARLAGDAVRLRERLATEVSDPGRRRWLDRQLVALEAQARVQAGESIGYLDMVERLFDFRPARRPDETFTEAGRELDRLLSGDGSLSERMARWDDAFTIRPERLPAVCEWLVGGFRERAERLFGLPAGEGLTIGFVRNQPWSGYNWYDGGLRSRVDLNLDLPVRAADLVHIVAHETYPGHHLEHAWKEADLVLTQGRSESSVLLINTPECLISEGLADLGHRFASPTADEPALLEELFARAGLPIAGDLAAARDAAETSARVAAVRRDLGAVAVNAALLRHADGQSHDDVLAYLIEVGRMDPERAGKRLAFIEHPTWRTYVFVYTEGEALLRQWLEVGPANDEPTRFARLLHEAPTPSGVAEEIDQG